MKYSILLCLFVWFFQPDSLIEKATEELEIPPLVQQELDKRSLRFLNDRKRKCIEEIRADAENYVDTTIINDIYVEVMDSIIFPERPFKPRYKGNIVLDDSTRINYQTKENE